MALSTPFRFLCYAIIILGSICCRAQAQQLDPVTNQTVIDLHSVGMSNAIITSKINNGQCTFDLSTNGLIALKKAGVPDDIITVMIAKGSGTTNQSTPTNGNSSELQLEPGLYFNDKSANQYIELDAAVLTNSKQGGFGEAMKRSVSGLFNAKQRATLSGTQANQKVPAGAPMFVFVFDKDKTGFNDNNRAQSNVESPNEFFLIRLQVGKNDREMVVGKDNSVGSNRGIDDASKVPFHYKKIQKGLFEVSTDTPLKPGEYCFMFAASSASEQGISHKVYDFSVQTQ